MQRLRLVSLRAAEAGVDGVLKAAEAGRFVLEAAETRIDT